MAYRHPNSAGNEDRSASDVVDPEDGGDGEDEFEDAGYAGGEKRGRIMA